VVISEDSEWFFGAFQEDMPELEGFNDCQELFVMGIVVLFSSSK
jgi:hypothetical protein